MTVFDRIIGCFTERFSRGRLLRVLAAVCVLTTVFSVAGLSAVGAAGADEVSMVSSRSNPDTGYIAYIRDDAELLSDEQRDLLLNVDMLRGTSEANMLFISVDRNPLYNSENYAYRLHSELFPGDETNSVLVYVDMQEREIIIDTKGDTALAITANVADTIADNCYTYLSGKEYYTGISKMFDQINSKMRGLAFAQPVRYISNAFLALIVGFFFTYIIAKSHFMIKFGSKRIPVFMARWNGRAAEGDGRNGYSWTPHITFTRTSSVYSPRASSGSGSGGRSGGHSGGFSGGHSGGGHHSSGGHRF